MSFIWITIPATLLLAAALLALVIRGVTRGDFDDWEGPAARHFLDDDADPERDRVADGREGSSWTGRRVRSPSSEQQEET